MMENEALVIRQPGEMVIEKCRVPAIEEDEVLIRVKHVAVCGSDIKLYHGSYTGPHKYPLIFGHEWLGEVVECSQKCTDETGIRIGMNVVGTCSVFCDECYYCGFNKNHCENIEKRGITLDGGACRIIAVKAKHVVACPETENEKLLTLTEPVSVAVNGILNHVPEKELVRTRRALITGCGGIGISALLTLTRLGIPEIVIVDTAKEKADYVRSFVPLFTDLKSKITVLCADITDPDAAVTGFDLIVEATGTAAPLQQAVYAANPCAHLVMLGHQKPMSFDFGTVMQKSLTIHASNGSTGGFPEAMELIRKQQAVVEKMITTEIAFADVPDYFREHIDDPGKIKVLINL